MHTQDIWSGLVSPEHRLATLVGGSTLPLGAGGGRLEVLHGRIWLTRSGDLDDHVVATGESLEIPASGQAVVEAWDPAHPALVAWRPTPLVERLGTSVRSLFGRCWEIVDPVRRMGAGTAAALIALLAGALLFGPLSTARTRALLEPTLLHNSAGARSSTVHDGAGTRTGSSDDVSASLRGRARSTPQEARRRPAGPA